MNDKDIWLFVGLGNPGNKYQNNRHNIGFMALDTIVDDVPSFAPFKTSKFQGELTETKFSGAKVVLLKPQTYMNESGRSVGAVARFYKIPPEKVVVLHDELDLNPGELRMKKGGGNAGHNGLKSIQAHMNTADFWRIRIGIGHPGERHLVSNYVLSDFAKAEASWVEKVTDYIASSYTKIIENDAESYMTEVNKFSKS